MAFFYIIVIILIAGSVGIMYEPFSYWTHRKGYVTPIWKFVVTLPLWLGFSGSFAVLIFGSFRMMDALYGPTAVGFLGLFLLILFLLAAGIGGTFLVLRLLPKRKMRMTGSRRPWGIPYAAIGYAAIIFAGAFVIFNLMLQDYYSYVLRCVLLTAAFSGTMFYQARRAKTPTVEEVLSQDQRPALLYLRSFDQELSHFVEVSPVEAAKYSEITSYAPSYTSYRLTLEQFLARQIKETIGPLIALGNPTDYLPPEGASRTYAADGGWQDYFTDLSNRSAAILMQMGNSDNLNWELVSVRERGLQTKMFVVTPPAPSDAGKYSATAFFHRLHDRIKGIQLASWDRFAVNLEKAGYKPPADDPGSGAVISFDEHNQGKRLVSGAKTPTDYVDAIYRQLQNFPEQRGEFERQRHIKERAESHRVEGYGIQIVICSSCGTENSLSFSKCMKCSKDLSKEKPVPNPYV